MNKNKLAYAFIVFCLIMGSTIAFNNSKTLNLSNTLFDPPTIDFTFNNNNVCSGITVAFNSTVTGNGGFDYLWSFGDGSTSMQANPNHAFQALGCGTRNFTVRLTVTDANDEESTITHTITVKEKPNLSFIDLDQGFGDPFDNCGNNTTDPEYIVNVGNQSSSSSCISSYNINWGDGNSETNVSFPITHTYLELGSFNMVITAVGDNGCNNTKTYLVKNSSNPIGAIEIPGNTVNLCLPVSAINFAIGSWGTNAPDTIYYVNYGDGTVDTYTQAQLEASSFYNASDPAASQNFPIPHTYTESNCPSSNYTVFLTISTSCGESLLTAGPIIILKKPEVDFDVDDVVCVDTAVQFINTSENGYNQNCTTNANFYWDFGDGSTSTDEHPIHIYTSPGNYTVSLYSENYCGETDPIMKPICVEPEITASFTLNTNNGCSALDVVANNTTDISQNCAGVEYLWEVVYASAYCGSVPDWSFTNGTDATSDNPSFNFVNPGIYTLQLSATNACGSNTITEIIEIKQPPTIVFDAINDFCGTASFNPVATVATCSPSSEIITYSWSFPGGTPANSSDLDPGTIMYTTIGNHEITLSVTNSCGTTTETENFSINETPTITNTDTNQTICSGSEFDAINVTSDNGSTTFSWSANNPPGLSGYTPSGTTNTIPAQILINTNSTATTLIYTVVPQIGSCVGAPVDFEIIVEPAPLIENHPIPNAVCLNGVADDLTVTIQGTGTPNYQWYENSTDNTTTGTAIAGATSQTFTPPTDTVGSIYYYVIITFSSGGCNEITSNTALIEVTNTTEVDMQPLNTQSICVGGTSSQLAVTITGGTGNITYQWYINTSNSTTGGTIIAGATAATYTPPVFTNTGIFYYYVEITSTASGCANLLSDVSEIVVVEDPIITSQPIPFQSLCQNVTPQGLEVIISNGLGNASYQWYVNTVNNTSGGVLISGATSQTFTPPTDAVGTLYYYCIITQDVSGCEVISEISEVELSAGAQFNSQPISDEICLGDTTATLVVSYTNGTGTPMYQWYQNTVNNTTTGTPIAGETTATYNPVVTAVDTLYYYCIITFNNSGCSELISDVAEITVNETPSISDASLLICSNNSFTHTPDASSGDTVPANTLYTWSTPVVNPVGSVNGATAEATPTPTISQFLENTTTNPATVTYTVTPVSGDCIGLDFQVVVTVNPAISVTPLLTDNTCFQSNNASIEITIVGGVPFGTGEPYLITWSGPNGFSSSDEDIFNLEEGIYNLDIVDDGGCPYSETFTIIEPEDLIFTAIDFDSNTISCFQANDGDISLTISGGTFPYNFNWIKDGLPFSTDEDLIDLGPGNYTVSVSDANNCGPITQSFLIEEPELLVVTLDTKTDVICFGDNTGAITINANGGRPDYLFSWVGPDGFTSTNQNIDTLFAGTYTQTITDSSGCISMLEITITQNEEIDIAVTTTQLLCYGDNNASITIDNISGGIAPYNITWSNFGTGNSQINLTAGIYTITITDAENCVKEFPIVIDEVPIFLIDPIVTQMSCAGENDASIVLNFVGGIDPVTVVWDDDATVGTERNNLAPGTYSVTITDGTPCVIQDSFTIFPINPLLLSANVIHALDCDDTNSGAINLLIQGGTLPYNIVWSNGATTEDLENIPPNNYTVQITDAHGCQIEGNWDVNRFEPLLLNVDTQSDVNCETQTINQTFVALASGGVPPFQFTWSSGTVSGANNEIMTTEEDGLIILDVTDSQGCTTNYSLNVQIPILGNPGFATESFGFLNYGIFAIQDPIQFTNTATGDFESILWDFGDGNFSSEENPTHTYLEVGNYVVTQTVTYPFGCVYTYVVTLIVENGYSLIMPNAFTPNNDGLNDNFGPVYKGLSALKLNVYDTWGSMIYSESGDDIKGWDGKVKNEYAENGNYYYTLSAKTFYDDDVNEKGAFVFIK